MPGAGAVSGPRRSGRHMMARQIVSEGLSDWQFSIRAKPHAKPKPPNNGIVRLSFKLNGSYNSVMVAMSAPKNAGYSRKCTSWKTVTARRKFTVNMASDPSMLFFPSRPIFLIFNTSPPKLRPISAALMSPRIRNKIDVMATDGANIHIDTVQPSEKKAPPQRVFCSFSLKIWPRGQLRRTKSIWVRAKSMLTPTMVMVQQI
mmetsp:Transcript_9085/g.21738  ORF Transcript_9085/g.21738 Transcript_9085/m.21738 type:complete len:202 (-) Transcript_9085:290-895(-)